MIGKRKRKLVSGWKVKVVFKELYVIWYVVEEVLNKLLEVNVFWIGESGGNLNVLLLLVVGNMDLIFVSEDF